MAFQFLVTINGYLRPLTVIMAIRLPLMAIPLTCAAGGYLLASSHTLGQFSSKPDWIDAELRQHFSNRLFNLQGALGL